MPSHLNNVNKAKIELYHNSEFYGLEPQSQFISKDLIQKLITDIVLKELASKS